MKFLALEHHLQLHPKLVVTKNPLVANGQNIAVAMEGCRANLCLIW